MSFFGLAILARASGRVADLPCIAKLLVGVDERRLNDDWRLAWLNLGFYVDPASVAAEVVADTGAPAIAIYINDGSYAYGAAASPLANNCEFYLDEPAFHEFCGEFDPGDLAGVQLDANRSAPEKLDRWAAEAGTRVDLGEMEAAFAAPVGHFHQGIHSFVRALGIADTQVSDPSA